MSLLNEMESLVAFFERQFPDKQIERQNIPSNAQINTIYVRAGRTDSNMVTTAAMLNSRLWEIIYCGSSTMDVLDVIDRLQFHVMNEGSVVPLNGENEHILHIRYFNFSQPFVNENGQSMVIGNFRGDTKTSRLFPEVGTIQKAKVNRPSGQ